MYKLLIRLEVLTGRLVMPVRRAEWSLYAQIIFSQRCIVLWYVRSIPHCIISSSVQGLLMYLVNDKVRFAKIISLKLMICHLVRLKYCHLRPSKNNYMLE